MEPVSFEQRGDVFIFNISGLLTIPAISDFIKTHCPSINKHAVYNLSNVSFDPSVKYSNLLQIAMLAKRHMTNRDPNGKTAHVCAQISSFGMLNMFATVLSGSGILHKQRVFKSLDEALQWISE